MRLASILLALTAGLLTAQDDPFADPLAAAGGSKHVKISLVSEQDGIVAGQPFTVALKLDHDKTWHTYWINPGIGTPTAVKWNLPEGFSAGPILWPVPHATEGVVGVQHSYDGTVYLLTEIKAPATLPGGEVKISGTVTWQECNDEAGCFPGGPREQTLKLPVKEPAVNAELKKAFDAVRAQQPKPSDAWKVELAEAPAAGDEEPAKVTFTLTPGEGANPNPGAIYFFDASKVLETDPQKPETKDGKIILTVARKEVDEGEKPQPPAGFFHAPGGWLKDGSLPALAFGSYSEQKSSAQIPVEPANGKPAETVAQASVSVDADIATIRGWGVRTLDGAESDALTWPLALLFAFLGGIILNLMPCVFPVLGIKILGFVRQSGEDHGAVKKHGLAYAAGILASMMTLAGVLITLRALGELLGWGFQLQNPVFLMCLIVLVFAVSLELAGLFEMGTSLTSVGAELQEKSGYSGSFFSGLLTVLLATPCTGPFMGPALGFALSKTTPIALVVAVFIMLSIGLALPYVLLSWFPALVKKLPRPGAWMETFKQVMAFPMFATCAWLITVFTASTGRSGLFYILFALVLLAMTLWLYGRFFTPAARPRSKRIALPFAVLCLAGGGFLAWQATAQKAPAAVLENSDVAYSPRAIIERREKGLTTVVDFWAEWCVLCESNKKLAFTRDEFRNSLREHNAAFMIADWTQYDPDIKKFLDAYDQGGIPFALVIPPKGPAIMLPSALPAPGEAIRGLVEAKQQAGGQG